MMLKSLEKIQAEAHTRTQCVISKVNPSRNTNQHRSKHKTFSIWSDNLKKKQFTDGKISHLRAFKHQFFP